MLGESSVLVGQVLLHDQRIPRIRAFFATSSLLVLLYNFADDFDGDEEAEEADVVSRHRAYISFSNNTIISSVCASPGGRTWLPKSPAMPVSRLINWCVTC